MEVLPCPLCKSKIETPKRRKFYLAAIFHKKTCMLSNIMFSTLRTEDDVTSWNSLAKKLAIKDEVLV